MQSISLIALVATPERFHGKVVRVVGWATFAFESMGIFVSQDQTLSSRNGLWLDVRMTQAMSELVAGAVIVEGLFDAESHGHLGMWSGTLKNITRLQTWARPMRNLLL